MLTRSPRSGQPASGIGTPHCCHPALDRQLGAWRTLPIQRLLAARKCHRRFRLCGRIVDHFRTLNTSKEVCRGFPRPKGPTARPTSGSACGNWLAVMGQERQNADSGCADIPRHSQSLRSPANVMCAGEVHPASLPLARVSCARNGTFGRVENLSPTASPDARGHVSMTGGRARLLTRSSEPDALDWLPGLPYLTPTPTI